MTHSKEPDPQAFRAFEHEGWQQAAEQYARDFEQITTQTVEPLLAAAAVTKGTPLLDVASGPEAALGLGIVLAAIQTHGNLAVPLPVGPPFFRFSDPDESKRVLRAAGFQDPQVQRVPQLWRLGSAEALYEVMCHATVRTAGLLRAQTPEALEQIRQAITDSARTYRDGNGVALPMPAMLALARE